MKIVYRILALCLAFYYQTLAFSQSSSLISDLLTSPKDTLEDDYSLLFLCRKDQVDLKKSHRIDPPAWEHGLLLDWNDQVLPIQGRYRPDAKSIQLLLNGETVWLDSEKFKGIRLGEAIYLTAPLKEGDPPFQTAVFFIVEDGRAALLRQEVNEKKALLYLYRYGQVARRFSGNKRKLLAFFQDRQLEVEHYLHEKDPNLLQEEDLRALFQYYNQL